MATTKKPSLAQVLAGAQKKYDIKAGAMSSIAEDVQVIPSNVIALDAATGVWGLPLGRSVELYGPPSCGKTTVALHTAAELQRIIKEGGDPERGISPTDKIAYFDYEYAMDPSYSRTLGFDPDDEETCVFAQPDFLETGADLMIEMIESGEVRLVIIDSIAGMTPKSIEENSVGKSLPAVQAKLLTTLGQKLNPILAKNNCLLIYLNHSKEVMAMGGYGPPQTSTPGGKAVKYFASMRVEFTPLKKHKSKFKDPVTQEEVELPTSTDVKINITKNKVGPPFKRGVARVRYGRGFDNFWTALQALLAAKKIVYSAGSYYFDRFDEEDAEQAAPAWMNRAKTGKNSERPAIRGEDNVFKMGDAHPEWRAFLIERAREIIHANLEVLEEVQENEDEEASGLDIEPASGQTKRVSL